jgi:hypothetical protein
MRSGPGGTASDSDLHAPVATLILDSITRAEIVDGFHRWTVSGYPELLAMTDGLVPVVVVATDPVSARISTIRFNRARGSHGVTRMSDIVVDLSEEFEVPVEEMMQRLGMSREEVVRLQERGRMVQRHRNPDGLGEAWKPVARK